MLTNERLSFIYTCLIISYVLPSSRVFYVQSFLMKSPPYSRTFHTFSIFIYVRRIIKPSPKFHTYGMPQNDLKYFRLVEQFDTSINLIVGPIQHACNIVHSFLNGGLGALAERFYNSPRRTFAALSIASSCFARVQSAYAWKSKIVKVSIKNDCQLIIR